MNNKINRISKIAVIVALMCVIAPLSIPIQPIPITLGTFVLWVVAMILPTKDALIAIGLFVTLGVLGVPVFGNHTGGLAKMLGPSGGFLWSWPFVPLFFAFGNKLFNNKYVIRFFGVITSFSFICINGVIWGYFYLTQWQATPVAANISDMMKGWFLVFIPTMIIKGIMASTVADIINKFQK